MDSRLSLLHDEHRLELHDGGFRTHFGKDCGVALLHVRVFVAQCARVPELVGDEWPGYMLKQSLQTFGQALLLSRVCEGFVAVFEERSSHVAVLEERSSQAIARLNCLPPGNRGLEHLDNEMSYETVRVCRPWTAGGQHSQCLIQET